MFALSGVLRAFAGVLGWWLAAAAWAATSTMTFEGLAPPGGFTDPATPYAEAGFVLTSNFPGEKVDQIASASSPPPINANGSDIFGWCGGCRGTPVVITLARQGGGAFDFIGFDTAVLQPNFVSGQVTNVIDVVGHHALGGTTTLTIGQTATWTYHAIGMANLDSVDFVYGAGHAVGAPDHAFDNLVLAAVPEPQAVAMLLAGSIVVGWSTRRRVVVGRRGGSGR